MPACSQTRTCPSRVRFSVLAGGGILLLFLFYVSSLDLNLTHYLTTFGGAYWDLFTLYTQKKNRLTGYSDTVVRSVCRYWRYMNRSKNFVRLSNVVSPLTLWSYRAKTLGFHSQLTNENIHVLVYNHILQEENTGQKTNSWSCSRHYRRRRNSGWTWTITEVSCKRFRFLLSLACAQALTLIIPLFLPFSSNFSPRSKKHGPAHGARLTTSSPKPTTIHYSSYQTYPENKTHNTTKAIRVSQRIPRR